MRGIAILVLQERKVLFRAKLQILTTKRLAWQGWAGLARLDPVGSDALWETLHKVMEPAH